MFHTRFLLTLTTSLALVPAATSSGSTAPDFPGGEEAETPYEGTEYAPSGDDTMALSSVSSVGVDWFYWYRNDSIGGDTFEIDSTTTNTAAPFQIAVQVEGTWDFTVHRATAIQVYTVGSGTTSVAAGTLTLGDGYHIIFNDTAAGGSELHIDMPGPGSSGSGSGSSGSGGGSGSPSPSGGGSPLWDEIEAEFAHVEWKMVEGRLQYRFLGNNAASTLMTDLHQASGSSDIDVSYIGDASCATLAFPTELEVDVVTVPAGHHALQAGGSGSGPWSLSVSWGPEPCEADLNGDGTVNFHDLMDLLSAWGGCP
ncbi:MAG: hypothetical protein QGG74_06380 [Phycisphaerales bacterium]|jgi:hypothetical protein|nr:hypothetical protein [Phycisphaerales bacterium]